MAYFNLLSYTRTFATSADFWVNIYRTNRDAASLKNASFALGRVCAMTHVCDSPRMDTTDPIIIEVLAISKKYEKIWVELV